MVFFCGLTNNNNQTHPFLAWWNNEDNIHNPKDDDSDEEQQVDDDDDTHYSNYGSIKPPSIDHTVPSLTSPFADETDWEVLRMCVVYIAIYIVIAVIAYSYVFESWTIIDSVYFAVNTFTTVGMVDDQPTTGYGQLFTVFFSVYGVIILGIFIGIIGHAISEGQSRTLQNIQKGRQEKMLKFLFMSSPSMTRSDAEKSRKGLVGEHVTLLDDVKSVCRAELPEILVVFLLAYILGVREGWSFTSTMYYTIMSASTTGFGDYVPKTQVDKLYAIFFLPLSVAVFGEVLGRIASVYMQRRIRKQERKFIRRTFTLCDLRRMDTDDDGNVDLGEFLSFMLVALGKCDEETLEDLKDIFDNLDKNGNGLLESEDLLQLGETPGWREVRKMARVIEEDSETQCCSSRESSPDDTFGEKKTFLRKHNG